MTTTMAPTSHEIDRYVAAVERRIAGRPAPERTEVLDDLAQHLSELAAEPGATITERLGDPDAYADELAASLGLASGPDPAADRARLRDVVARVAAGPTATALRGFLPELRPGWWVARGYLAVAAIAALDGRHALPFPELGGNGAVGVVVAIAAAVASVHLGRRRGWVDRTASIAGAIAVLVVAANLDRGPVYTYVDTATVPSATGYLTAADGRPISNLYVYDRDGNLLTDVFVFDSAGRPIAGLADFDPDTGAALAVAPQFDANGAPILNVFPRRLARESYPAGTAVPVAPPAVVVPRLDEPTTTTTTAPSTSTTAPPATLPPGG